MAAYAPCRVPIPDGYELAEELPRVPRETDWFLDSGLTGEVHLCSPTGLRISTPRFIVRRKWVWPAFVAAAYMAKDASGSHYAYSVRPNCSRATGMWTVSGHYIRLDPALTPFVEIPGEWYDALRENPNIRNLTSGPAVVGQAQTIGQMLGMISVSVQN